VGTVAFEVEDLRVELGGGMDAPVENSKVSDMDYYRERYKACSHDIAVDDLNHRQSAIITHRIEGLGLDIGVLEGAPPQILLGEFGITSSFGLLSDGLDGFGAVDRFLRAGNTGQTVGQRRDQHI